MSLNQRQNFQNQDDFNSFCYKKTQKQQLISTIQKNNTSKTQSHISSTNLMKSNIEVQNTRENRQTFRADNLLKQSQNDYESIQDPNVKNLIGEIDDLLSKIGNNDGNQDFASKQSQSNFMIQTGQFALNNNSSILNENFKNNNIQSYQPQDFLQRQNPFGDQSNDRQNNLIVQDLNDQQNYQQQIESQNYKSALKTKSVDNKKKKVTIANDQSVILVRQQKVKQSKQSNNQSSSESSMNDKIKQKSIIKHDNKKSKKKQVKNSDSSSDQSQHSNQKGPASKISLGSQISKRSQNVSQISQQRMNQINQNINDPKIQVKGQQNYTSSQIQNMDIDVFCVSCEEFISNSLINNHVQLCQPKQNQNEILYINEKIIKINFLLGRKSKSFFDQNMIKASKIIQTITEQMINTQKMDLIQKYLNDLYQIQTTLEKNNQDAFSESFLVLHSYLIKICEFSERKQTICSSQEQKQIEIPYQNNKQRSHHIFQQNPAQQQPQFNKNLQTQQQKQLSSQPRNSTLQKYNNSDQNQQNQYFQMQPKFIQQTNNNHNQDNLSLLNQTPKSIIYQNFEQKATNIQIKTNHNQQKSIFNAEVNQYQLNLPNKTPQLVENVLQPKTSQSQKALNYMTEQQSSNKKKQKLFEIIQVQQVQKQITKPNCPIVDASKARKIDQQIIETVKENKSSFHTIQGNQTGQQKFQSPVRQQEGIILGNNAPLKNRPYIKLSNSKKSDSDQKNEQNDEYIYKRKNQPIQQLQLSRIQTNIDNQNRIPPKKPNSVISGISEFFNKITVLSSAPPIQANTEAQKKNFFDLAVQNKNLLGQDHHAQQIMIADLYQKCLFEKIAQVNWNEWIIKIYTQA